MSGRWTSVAPGGRTFTDTWSVVLDGPGGTGPFTGRLTLRGVQAHSQARAIHLRGRSATRWGAGAQPSYARAL